MSLRMLAESDLGFILEDAVTGFGWPITLTNPDGATISMTGFSNDIAQVIDPDTGQAVSGRSANCSLRMSSIRELGGNLVTECGETLAQCGETSMQSGNVPFGLPRGIADSDSKPWIATFLDIGGLPHTFKIIQSNPDRALGVLSCLLEIYEQ